MKMKRLISAIGAFQRLSLSPLPLHTAYELKRLIDDLQKDVDFYTSELQKGRKDEELLDFEITDRGKIRIVINNEITLSVNDLTALEPFIEFAEVQNNA